MLNICIFVLQVLLFVLLTPGILIVLPPKSSKYVVALTHGIVFSALWILLYKPFCRFCSVMRLEGLVGKTQDNDEDEGFEESSDDNEKKETSK
jgi:hypothetical protein